MPPIPPTNLWPDPRHLGPVTDLYQLTMMAGYATLSNSGDLPVTVLTVQSDAFRMASLHETIVDKGVAKMREIHRIVIAPGAAVSLEPGGRHLMLMQPRHAIVAGEKVEVMFLLNDGARVETHFDVPAAGDAN